MFFKKTIVFLFLLVAVVQADIDKSQLKFYLPNAKIIVEAGAHIGLDTVQLAETWPSATIFAFEPVPKLFEKLRLNVSNFQNVVCIPLALSSETGNAQFFVSGEVFDQSSSLLEPKEHLIHYPHVAFSKSITVETKNLDEWASQNNIAEIDLMWLDMQGAEFSVLKASPTMVARAKAIYVEIAYCELYKGSHLFQEVNAWFESQGYVLAYTDHFSSVEGNALFLNKRYFPNLML